jgi:hypothetical protein
MNKKFYPITILEKDGSYLATIAELGITTKGQNYNEALEACIFEKDKTIKMLIEKKIPLPDIFENQVFKLFQTKIVKKLFLFTAKSIGSTLIFLITLLILFVMISPFVKSYLKSPYAAEHFSKISQKFGINMCIEKKCIKPND